MEPNLPTIERGLRGIMTVFHMFNDACITGPAESRTPTYTSYTEISSTHSGLGGLD